MQRHKRRPLRPERLHPYSRGFYEFLVRERPEWLQHAFNVLGYCHKQFDLEVDLPHPAGSKPIGRLRLPAEPIHLWINDGEELSISYSHWHTHAGLDRQGGHPAEDDYKEILELADSVMADQRVFVAKFHGDKLVSSTSLPVERLEEELIEFKTIPGEGEIIVRSWSGKLDQRLR